MRYIKGLKKIMGCKLNKITTKMPIIVINIVLNTTWSLKFYDIFNLSC